MKTIVVFLLVTLFAFDANTQTPFMVCKPGGYSKEDLINFLFKVDEVGNLVLKEDTFVQNYANHFVRIVNHGYLRCDKDYSITTNDLAWVIENSHVENVDMKSFMNSRKYGNEIEFFRDTFNGGLRIHEYDGCRVPTMKDTCANLVEYEFPTLPGTVQNKRPAFVVEGNDPDPNGVKDPSASGEVDKNTTPKSTQDTSRTPVPVAPPIADNTKAYKAKSWQEEEWLRQQHIAMQGIDTSGAFSQSGSINNYNVNSFNTTYIMPTSSSGGSSQENNDGQYVYHRGSWVPVSYTSYGYGGTRIRIHAGVRVGYGVSNFPSYCPTGLPYDGYWDGNYYRSALDGRTIAQDHRGNWQYQGGPSPNVDYSVLNQNRWKPETTGYTSNSYHPSTHSPVQNTGRVYGPRGGF